MSSIINYADGEIIPIIIDVVNELVSGMSAGEAAAAMGVSETSGLFTVIEGGSSAADVIKFADAAGAAWAEYELANGAISVLGSATAEEAVAANIALTATDAATGVTAMGAATIGLEVLAAAAVAYGGYKVTSEFWNSAQGEHVRSEITRVLEPFKLGESETFLGLVDENGVLYFPKLAIEAIKNLFDDEQIRPNGEADLDDESILEGEYRLPLPLCNAQGRIGRHGAAGGWNYALSGNGPFYGVRVRNSGLGVTTGRFIVVSPNPFTGVQWLNTLPGQRLDIAGIGMHTTRNGTTFWYVENVWDSQAVAAGQVYYDETQPIGVITRQPATITDVVRDVATIILDGEVTGGVPGLYQYEGEAPEIDEQEPVFEINYDGSRGGAYIPVSIDEDLPYETSGAEVGTPNPPEVITPLIPNEVSPGQYTPETVPDSATRTNPIQNLFGSHQPKLSPNANPSALPDVEPASPISPPVHPLQGGYSPVPFVPDIQGFPTIIPSSGPGLIHVYNPTPTEFVNFGKWLWVTYADASIDKIWNNPFDGVIGAFEIYSTPAVDGKDNIYSGFLTCPVESNLVRQRYTKIDCGSIIVPEYYGNYLDYAPYTKVHMYLPFIGIVELNSDDIIGHAVNTAYYVDAYNGSCIAQITVAKTGYENTVYQFSGNCAVEVPLAGGSQAAIRAGMISAAATGITSVIGGVASMLGGRIGAGISTIAYGAGSAVSQAVSNKSSVQHSGTFGASYGAMGIKIPYIIVHRPIQKEVYNYNRDYGFPAHKRVVIGACSGYIRVREVDVVSAHATDDEKAKIEEMLKGGVFV